MMNLAIRMLKLSTFLSSLFLLTISNTAVAVEQVVLDAVQDSYVHKGSASSNFGSETELLVKLSNSGNGDRNAYIYFDLSSFSAPLASAYFRIGIESSSGSRVRVSSTDELWSEGDINWNSSLGSLSSLVDIPAVEDAYLKADVLDLVNTYIANNKSGLTLVISALDTSTSSLKLAALEHDTSFKRPRLYVEAASSENPFSFGVSYSNTEKGNYTGHTLESVQGSAELSEYGGWLDWNLGATGYFRTQKVDGTWMLVDPLGYAFISVGLNTIFPGGGIDLPNAVKDIGINTMGSWSDESIEGLAYTPRWNILNSFKNTTEELKALDEMNIVPVFDPAFENYADSVAQGLAAYKDDPYVLGHFSDNELLFHKDQLSLSLSLDSDNAQYIAADTWMKDQYGNNYSVSDITFDDEEAYRGYVVETYSRIVNTAMKRYDPNHLFLGTRIHSSGKYSEAILAAAGKYTDVISINYYGAWEPDSSTTNMWDSVGEKPFIITEFYTKATDSGLENGDGAGWLVDTQQARSDYFENFALQLLGCKSCVGWHWFRYVDNNDSNKGVLSVNYEAYQTLQDSMQQVAQQVYPLRSQLLYGNLDFDGAVSTSTPTPTPTPGAEFCLNPAISASGSDGNVAGNTLDGDLSTRWSANGNSGDVWLQLDCGSLTAVTGLNIAFYKGNERSSLFTLQGSEDGLVWSSLLGNQSSSGNTLEKEYFSFSETEVRYIRYIGLGNSSNTWNSITEVSITASDKPMLAEEIEFAVSSITASADDGNVAGNVLDKTLSTRWSANGLGQWIQADMGYSIPLSSIKIAWFNGDNRSADFEILTSNDGNNWTSVYQGLSSGETLELEHYPLQASQARFIRVLGSGNSANLWNSVTELEVYGSVTY